MTRNTTRKIAGASPKGRSHDMADSRPGTAAQADMPAGAPHLDWTGGTENFWGVQAHGDSSLTREWSELVAIQKLAREDLMEMEGLLCRQLSAFLSFSGHALYFPREHTPEEPRLLTRERRLLLPLHWGGRQLGMVMLHGVRVREVRPLLKVLPALASLCLENLARAKAVRTDAVTGLATEESLFARMEGEAERVRAHLEEPSAPEGLAAPMYRMCMGIVLLRLSNGPDMIRRYGYAFDENVMRQLAAACRAVLPSDVLAARVGTHEMALLLSASGRGACHKLACAVLARMQALRPVPPLTKQGVAPRLCAGHALYPQDMQGAEMRLGMYEQARLLMARARLAADVAGQTAAGAAASRSCEGRVMPFARILQEGGLVLETLPVGRLRISLGRQAKAREGMRFAVWSAEPDQKARHKGEIVLLRVGDRDSIAEILHLVDTTFLPAPGDSLALLGQSPVLSPDLDGHDPVLHFSDAQGMHSIPPVPSVTAGQQNADVAPAAEIPGHARQQVETDSVAPAASPAPGASPERDAGKAASFAASFTATSGSATAGHAQAEGEPAALAPDTVAALNAVDAANAAYAADAGQATLCGHGDFLNRFAQESERRARFVLAIVRMEGASSSTAATALRLWEKLLREAAPHDPGSTPLAGLYGSNSLIFFHPGSEPQNVVPLYEALCSALNDEGVDAAAGLAAFPFLQYRKAEMPDCALRALEYALLLPHPRVGQCNSLALNISADRRYSLGDVFGALEEYKLALLADETNVMAWNSLGVCMAALGRRHEARRHFLEALRHKPDESTATQINYNLGNVCQSLGERRAAARYYRQCVKTAPDHLFAHIRLGQLCEQSGKRAEARRYYELAAAIEDAAPGRPGVARRHLARVAARQRKGGEARELLHEALLRNPQDAASMLLLANIYLDGNEDPAMAELLARKSAGQHDRPEAWQTLARALRALDREDEARLAEARAVLG
ncbi:diguanylate cyclase [Desulfovibrio sp. MES5]|uniref:diguanylate cyclase n=1 Tax=Desulfovibrio sp. MES5 TaxID=1899016 RepID=UPI0025BE65C3|nr:diguanylate cyclase [Desulfovibrio sp. MES5]